MNISRPATRVALFIVRSFNLTRDRDARPKRPKGGLGNDAYRQPAGRQTQRRRSMGTIVGDEPAWMLPMTSNPCRSYNGTLRGFDDSR